MRFLEARDLYLLLVIALMKAASWAPLLSLKEFLVNSIAFAAYHLSMTKRRISEKNLSEVFDGELDRRQVRRTVKGAFYEFWRDAFSLLPSSTERAALERASVHGAEHLECALKKGRGVVLWESSGFGRRNLAKQILRKRRFSIHQLHAENHLGGFGGSGTSTSRVRRQVIRPFFERREQRFLAEIIYLPNSDSLAFTRILLGCLKQNAILCSAGDGRSGQKRIALPFLGRTGLFSTGMVSLARVSGASILPMFCLQERSGETSLVIESPIRIETDVERERSLEDSVIQYVRLLESYVREHPEKYRSWHLLGRFFEH